MNIVFHFLTNSSFKRKELLNFHNPFPLHAGAVENIENKIGEWLEDNAGRISESLIDSFKVFEKNNLIFSVENLSDTSAEMWNVSSLCFYFCKYHISCIFLWFQWVLKQIIFLRVALLPSISSTESTNKLKSPPRVIIFFQTINCL